jgi:hypothetical protein
MAELEFSLQWPGNGVDDSLREICNQVLEFTISRLVRHTSEVGQVETVTVRLDLEIEGEVWEIPGEA